MEYDAGWGRVGQVHGAWAAVFAGGGAGAASWAEPSDVLGRQPRRREGVELAGGGGGVGGGGVFLGSSEWFGAELGEDRGMERRSCGEGGVAARGMSFGAADSK